MNDDNKITIFTSATPPKRSLKHTSQKKSKPKEIKKGACVVVGCEQQCDASKTKCSGHLHTAKLYQKKYRTKKAQEVEELRAQLERLRAELESSKRREVQYQERLKTIRK